MWRKYYLLLQQKLKEAQQKEKGLTAELTKCLDDLETMQVYYCTKH